MRLLLCCESYFPHGGGVQEVMRQLAERMAAMGHDVTVATSWHPKRKSTVINGVNIRSFRAGGKMPYGLNGEIDRYRQFVETSDADAILIMAAQQWTFDALWSVLDRIRARKVFIPCGFSCLYEPEFEEYFKQIPDALRKFDHLIFNAKHYRDIDFVRALGLTNFTIIPNGVSENEFEQQPDPLFRKRLGISEEDFVFLTVGNPIEAKGHPEVIEAFARLDTGGRPTTLICIADWSRSSRGSSRGSSRARYVDAVVRRVVEITRREGLPGIRRLFRRKWPAFKARLIRLVHPVLGNSLTEGVDLRVSKASPDDVTRTIDLDSETPEAKAKKASTQPGKQVLLIDLPRSELIQAYLAADLFVFASKIEYSPLVLFEAAAAGTPFVTVPVGNGEEIVRWTQGGILCDAVQDDRGYTRVDPQVLAAEMSRSMRDPEMLHRLGTRARERWRKFFTWRIVTEYYEAILAGKTPDAGIKQFSLPN